ncbi:ParB/RepB/Spo0J family partition protein [Alkalitalea saponilacus]|uniref:Chromosome partitioning protein, ParB family n=1 Tax=Alkalitalea saponilacus TaxID=889453 RepID=A0A1T5A3D0_9BACT|nr:ParB/RepB/Spo0J family partition protein [Alkalitalea saponilacus]ASB48877.1 chromosome partitioning protein ParB [Alkalitalea saponilacus]SKB29395.1 chromosome partitioning protein, ParB family [Alkalitalea saponilacus]
MAKKSALGRGLGALIDNTEDVRKSRPAASIMEIEISKIEANPWQPRSHFDEERLNELALSIKGVGIVQPLTLRKISDDSYQIIAGERRFRAAKLAGLNRVPAYVRDAEDDTMLELALVENIQREDLDPIEVAISYQRLMEECKLTQESLSDKVGKKRSTIANYLRLLKLPAEIQLGLRERQISMGHARAIINVENPKIQIRIFNETIDNDYSVRKVEEMVRKAASGEIEEKPVEKPATVQTNPEYDELKQQLSNFFKTNIQFSRNDKGNGKIIIPFRSDEELEKIISILDKKKE